MKLTSKLPNLSLTIFSEMTQLADRYGAINLSQGFPDYEVPAELPKLVAKYMQQGCNQYAPMQGALQLREQISAKVWELYSGIWGRSSDYRIIQYPRPKASTLAFRRFAGPSLRIRLPSRTRCSAFRGVFNQVSKNSAFVNRKSEERPRYPNSRATGL
jgi:hypothetical protein